MISSVDFPQLPGTERQIPASGMSVPNPKRSIPVNLLNLSEDDSFGPFAEDTQILGGTRAIRSPIMELNAAASQEGRLRIPLGSTARTPELFDLNGENSAQAFGLDPRPVSRGVIGSARKCRSSASILEEGQGLIGSTSSVGTSSVRDQTPSLQGGAGSDSSKMGPWDSVRDQTPSLQGGAGSDSSKMGAWDSVLTSEVRVQSPIGRPTSTPVYTSAVSGLFGGALSIGTGQEGSLPESALLGGANIAGCLHLSGSSAALAGTVRGRDRDYSFGSLLGLAPSAEDTARSGADVFVASQRTPSAPLESMGLFAQADSALLPSRGNSRASGSIFADSSLAKPLGLGPIKTDVWPPSAGISREQEIRSSLPLTGTVSAPPLLNMYSYGYHSINNTSAFGTSSGPTGRFEPLKSRYDSAVLGLGGAALSSRILEPEQPDGLRISQSARTPPPVEAPLAPIPVPQPVPTSGPDPESVEGVVLRSCRDILAGAAEHSLKAVELANTLRARVGTEALARIREKWGGLLSLLEKHGATFRVDRIPKNDKVTLIQGLGDELRSGVLTGGSQSGAQRDGIGHGSHGASHTRVNSGHDGDLAAAAGGVSGSSATRCLHVGNVPANMTEAQLAREFEKFGQLEGIKLVAQRNGTRRFAFITFVTVEQAVSARHALSKVHPWKSAISFAHKDFGGSNNSQSEGASSRSGHNSGGHTVAGVPAQTRGGYSNPVAAAGKMYGSGMSDYQAHLMYHMQQQGGGGGAHMMMGAPGAVPYPYMGMNINMNMGMPYGGSGPLYWMQAPPAGPAAQFPGGQAALPIAQQQLGGYALPPQYQARAPATISATATATMDPECPVLQRLCDDTYVPTQPWPVDARDQAYCAAVVAQLQQFGGCTTVSKLRGFLRNRISAVDNIKSVPLKAMLVAYPHLFVLENNYVYLVGGGGAPGTGVVPQSAAQGYAGNL